MGAAHSCFSEPAVQDSSKPEHIARPPRGRLATPFADANAAVRVVTLKSGKSVLAPTGSDEARKPNRPVAGRLPQELHRPSPQRSPSTPTSNTTVTHSPAPSRLPSSSGSPAPSPHSRERPLGPQSCELPAPPPRSHRPPAPLRLAPPAHARQADAGPVAPTVTGFGATTMATVPETQLMPQRVTIHIHELGNNMCRSTGRGDGIQKLKQLGKGGYGVVWLCERSDPMKAEVREPQHFALKELISPTTFRPALDGSIKDHLPLNEAAIQQFLCHDHVVSTYWADVRVLDPSTGQPLDMGVEDLIDGTWTSLDRLNDLTTTLSCTTLQASGAGALFPEVQLQMRIAMEHCDLGSLRDYLTSKPERKRPLCSSISHGRVGRRVPQEYCAMMTALDIAEALKCMHKNNIIHADLKPMNVLLVSDPRDKGFKAKLSDFGLSAHMHADQSRIPITNGTVSYLPRDAFENLAASEATDVYAFGLLMWEIWYGIFWGGIWQAEKRSRIARRSSKKDMFDYRPACGPDCPRAYANLVHACLDTDPSKRPKAKELAKELGKMTSDLIIESMKKNGIQHPSI